MQDYASNFLTVLEKFAKENANKVYKYGDDVLSASELTAENAARMKGIAKRAGIIGNVVTASDIAQGFVQDNGTIGQNTRQAIAEAVGGAIGAYEGAMVGAAFGGVLGTAVPIIGNAAGVFVGGIFGAIIGGYIGSEMGEYIEGEYFR